MDSNEPSIEPDSKEDTETEILLFLKNYLLKTVPNLTEGDPRSFAETLDEVENEKILLQFIRDYENGYISVKKEEKKSSSSSDDTDFQNDQKQASYIFSLNTRNLNPNSTAILFVRRVNRFQISIPFHHQLYISLWNETSPIEAMLSYIRHCFLPYSQSLTNDAKSKNVTGIHSIKSKLQELESELIRNQPNLSIPVIKLETHKRIYEVLNKAKSENREFSLNEFNDEKGNSPEFKGALVRVINDWRNQIQAITRLDRDVYEGDCMQEINFWLNMEEARKKIESELKKTEVVCTLDLLKNKASLAHKKFSNDLELHEFTTRVQNYYNYVKYFPINDLLISKDFTSMKMAIYKIFDYIGKNKHNSNYPLIRSIHLVNVIGNQLVHLIKDILKEQHFLKLDMKKLKQSAQDVDSITMKWQTEYNKFLENVKKIMNITLKDQNKIPSGDRLQIYKLQQRIQMIKDLGVEHETLRNVVVKAFSGDKQIFNISIQRIDQSWQELSDPRIDHLDISESGEFTWKSVFQQYKTTIEKVEIDIRDKIQEMLMAAGNDANELFRVCAKFNPLFVRDIIKSAINNYIDQLVDTIQKGIDNLENQFHQQYEQNSVKTMSLFYDIPVTSGKYIWTKQLKRQLEIFKKRIEDVLGKSWKSQKLEQQVKNFDDKLGQQLIKLNSSFQNDCKVDEFEHDKPIFTVIKKRGKKKALITTFDSQYIPLVKEIKTISKFCFINTLVTNYKDIYTFVPRLEEAFSTYSKSCIKAEASDDKELKYNSLVNKAKKKVQKTLRDGIGLKWLDHNEKISTYTDTLIVQAVQLQDKVEELLEKKAEINQNLERLSSSYPLPDVLKKCMSDMQNIITFFDKKDFSSVSDFVEELDKRIEDILVEKLEVVTTLWLKQFEEKKEKIEEENEDDDDETEIDLDKQNLDKYVESISKSNLLTKHTIKMQNNLLQVFPPLHESRISLFKQLQDCMNIVCNLKRLTCLQLNRTEDQRYYGSALVSKLSLKIDNKIENKNLLLNCYTTIENVVNQSSNYANTWLQYQALWDIDITTIFNDLGEKIENWEILLNQMRKARSIIDTPETQISFGPITIDYASVQTKINDKYDSLQKEVLKRFSDYIFEKINELFEKIKKARTKLEATTIDFGTTSDIVTNVTMLQEMNKQSRSWQQTINECKQSEKILEKHRFVFPDKWFYADRLIGEWKTFQQILTRKLNQLNNEKPTIQNRIVSEDENLEKQVEEFFNEWDKDKPVHGNVPYNVAIQTLSSFSTRLDEIADNINFLNKVKEALDMPTSDVGRIPVIKDEIVNLQDIWNYLGTVWVILNKQEDMRLIDCKSVEQKSDLKKCEETLRKMPNNVRNHEAYHFLLNTLKDHMKMNGIIGELNSGVLRPKHQKAILKDLKCQKLWNNLTLNDLWSFGFLKNEQMIHDHMEEAQGENALEEFLAEISRNWDATFFETVNFKNKENSYLIRNWDQLLAHVMNDLREIQGMKNSPYFKAFEKEAVEWEQKLNLAKDIFDIFLEVQRKFVYLEGVFTNSQDVQQQLPIPYSHFRTFNKDFNKLTKAMHNEPQVDVWCQDERNVLKRMQDSAETLQKIQKALFEYLEKQRKQFPRFYFVGDEDLLEIIGNGNVPKNVICHLPKMFQGLCTINLDESGRIIEAMASTEGEVVPFATHINVDEAENPSIQDWLSKTENQMKVTLASLLEDIVDKDRSLSIEMEGENGLKKVQDQYFSLNDKFPAQIVLLASQINFSESVERMFTTKSDMNKLINIILSKLVILSERILTPLSPAQRKKYEQLITELVHHRDIGRTLLSNEVNDVDDFGWLYYMRFYWQSKADVDVTKKLLVRDSRANFFYGFEYLGASERLVSTPLTDRTYFTLSEALHARLGGNPFGPAGTGKTETVKAMANQLGRFCLVFNCDENFDLNAMGRIFVGLCQCGAWGCFDEFNRLEERILSAVSQQILIIQTGLREGNKNITLLKKSVYLNQDMGIFVTMNPGYAGRSNLPDNLKQLFRGIAMIHPDRRLIAQVMLFSQGFRSAELLSSKIVLFFELCADQLSNQFHYDFGLRALKSVLRSAGGIKRTDYTDKVIDESKIQNIDEFWLNVEIEILLRSIFFTIVPKLVVEDVILFDSLLSGVFPGIERKSAWEAALKDIVFSICQERFLVPSNAWLDKLMQLYQISEINHGIMLVGPTGSGKSSCWSVLLDAIEVLTKTPSVRYIIDPKSISKEHLYGRLDPTTLEWTDGVLTNIIRKILANVRGEQDKRHWIVFDGDVDPNWAENLNSVLDDNKLLTLPSGERLALTPNIRLIFEVKDLKYATLATVSRCGMVYFSDVVLNSNMIYRNRLAILQSQAITDKEGRTYRNWENIQDRCVKSIMPYFGLAGLFNKGDDDATKDDNYCLVNQALSLIEKEPHIMDLTRIRVLTAMFSIIRGGITRVLEYNDTHFESPVGDTLLSNYMSKYVLFAIFWGFGGSIDLYNRETYSNKFGGLSNIPLPQTDNKQTSALDYQVSIEDGNWRLWKDQIENDEMEAHDVVNPEVVIETVDTIRHVEVLQSWLLDHRLCILCGPPGSGKSMTLTSVLRTNPEFELVTLNFSSTTTPDLILKTFDHYCEEVSSPSGPIIRPLFKKKWLVIFCDEINLPQNDSYGTQHVITFLRQIIQHGGFWRCLSETRPGQDRIQFLRLERIQFVGACNPPTDSGRVVLTERFLRHCPLLFVDFPSRDSLSIIYGAFNHGLLKLIPALHKQNLAAKLTESMVEVYWKSQRKFTPDQHPHYIYSPRELTRWTRGIYEAMKTYNGNMDVEELVRLWLHEGLRLFQDRLVEVWERKFTDELFDSTAQTFFATIADLNIALKRPVLFTNWLTKTYSSVDQEQLRDHIQQRLINFQEEEINVELVVFDEVIEHILRIDRILKQPIGHALLVGSSGAGKTILSRFVSFIGGLSVFCIKVHREYGASDFDKDLRSVLIRSGVKKEKICFIFDESNVLDTAFLERMNALLASGEVPGLFEDNDFTALINECRETYKKEGITNKQGIGVSEWNVDDIYRYFGRQVQLNLHVVFTMNPANPDFENRSSTSPALFNRCVVDWFGTWSPKALFQVALHFTRNVDMADLGKQEKKQIETDEDDSETKIDHLHINLVNTIVFVHQSIFATFRQLTSRGAGRSAYLSPRHYLDLISHFNIQYRNKREKLEEQQMHLSTGLSKLQDTTETVNNMQKTLKQQEKELDKKTKMAKQKLDQVVKGRSASEIKKKDCETLVVKLNEQNTIIQTKTENVEKDLSQVQPMVNEAKTAVNCIEKKDLSVLAALPHPPEKVKLALEAVLLLMRNKNFSKVPWLEIKKLLNLNFKEEILLFKAEHVSDKTINELNEKYMSHKDFNFESINQASQACGPMVKWVIAQVNYAKVSNSVEPLTKELRELKSAAEKLQKEYSETEQQILEEEKIISQFEEEYSQLISETNKINDDIKVVKRKLDRSVQLIKNLESEKTRWHEQSINFKEQLQTLVGDCLLSAGFLAYIGFFDITYRKLLVNTWHEKFSELNINYNKNLSFIEYLSKPSEQLEWKSNDLPDDELCIENAVILTNYNRYPLIIDPSGQAVNFLLKLYSKNKVIRSSFHDKLFVKNLENALRFGNVLLVEDVEKNDPIVNPVLNHETRNVGGRVIITIGDRDIDFSPQFNIFLSTRDPHSNFTPDFCSRVTFINFTITAGSLHSQCLSQILKAERPDIDKKRSDQLKLQGEFKVRIRDLQDQLLSTLNKAAGNILEDDKIVNQLETLKKEYNEIEVKMSESEEVMLEMTTVSYQYSPFAQSCSEIYFTLEYFSDVHFLYRFSVSQFLSIIDNILHNNPELEKLPTPLARLDCLFNQLFETTFNRIAHSLLQTDHIPLALKLAQIKLGNTNRNAITSDEIDFLLKGKSSITPTSDFPKEIVSTLGISNPQAKALNHLCCLKRLKSLKDHICNEVDIWKKYINSDIDEPIPTGWEEKNDEVTTLFHKVLITYVFRPFNFKEICSIFISKIFTEHFLMDGVNVDLAQVVLKESNEHSPLLLCSKPGFDPSKKVDQFAHEQKISNYQSFAMGSAEGYDIAMKAIQGAFETGGWILIKNVHLSPNWLNDLEKRLHRQTHVKKDFRLFMTSEINPKLPRNLIRMSTVIIFEPPIGMKYSLMRTFNNISIERSKKPPMERGRLYFLLAWIHAVIMERLRYLPVGWTKGFEFSESDQDFSLDSIDQWLDHVAQKRSNLPPQKIPWHALQKMLKNVAYGGRIDNPFDQARLDGLVDGFFTSQSYDINHPLCVSYQTSENGNERKIEPILIVPDHIEIELFKSWVDKLPDVQSPEFLGLPPNADKIIQKEFADHYIRTLSLIQIEDVENLEADNVIEVTEDDSKDVELEQPQWMKNLLSSIQEWIQQIDISVKPLQRDANSIKNPLWRCIDRENTIIRNSKQKINNDLETIKNILNGVQKPTQSMRKLLEELKREKIPINWVKLNPESQKSSLNFWISDFVRRTKQMKTIAEDEKMDFTQQNNTLWLGGFFSPQAYFAGTRQAVAQLLNCGLDSLYLTVSIEEEIPNSALINIFVFEGCTLFGAAWRENALSLTTKMSTKLPFLKLKWVNKDESPTPVKNTHLVTIPVYLDSTRNDFLFSVELLAPNDLPDRVWSDRGTSISVWCP